MINLFLWGTVKLHNLVWLEAFFFVFHTENLDYEERKLLRIKEPVRVQVKTFQVHNCSTCLFGLSVPHIQYIQIIVSSGFVLA